MIKLGSYEIPGIRIEEAIDAARALEQNLLGKEASKEAFAKALGQSPNSGSFFVKLADLRRYGLISGRGDTHQTTQLAKTLAYEKNPQNYQEARQALVFSIPLFKELYTRFEGAVPTETQFEIAVREITGEHPETIKKEGDKVRKFYLEATSGFSQTVLPAVSASPLTRTASIGSDSRVVQPAATPNKEGVISLYYGAGEKVVLEETPENIEVFIAVLQNRKKKLSSHPSGVAK